MTLLGFDCKFSTSWQKPVMDNVADDAEAPSSTSQGSSSSSDTPINEKATFHSPSQAKRQTLSSSVNGDMEAEAYREELLLCLLYHLLGVLSLGILYLPAYWRPDWKVYMCCTRSLLPKATHLVIKVLSQWYMYND